MPSVGREAMPPNTTVNTSEFSSRLDDDPRRAEHRLLVKQRDVALDQQEDQVAVVQKLAEVDVEPAVAAGG